MIKEKKFYTLKNDVIFKNTFDTKESLKRLLEETLNLKVTEIYKSNTEMPIKNIKEKRKYLDLILETDKGIINVEVNHNYKEEILDRNFLYFCKMLSSSVKRKKSYLNIKKHIQLNITWNLQKYFNFDIKMRKIIKCHVADDETHNKLHENIFEIVHINMDYFERVWYHGNVKEENPFLMLLAAPTKEKMDIICKGDKLMSELNKRVEDLNDDNDVLDVIIENEDEILLNSRFDSGFNQGVKEGINQTKIETAKKLLKNNIDIDIISKSTGLSKKQINDLNDDNDVLDVIIENEDEILLNSRFDSGFNQGVNQTKIEIAKKLLAKNMDIKEIGEITNISEKEIEALK